MPAGVGAGNSGLAVDVKGLQPLLRQLRGPAFRDVNSELRDQARFIADGIVPEIRDALRLSRAPQAAAFTRTVKSKRDRVPVVVIGATNPALPGFSRRGSRRDGQARMSTKWRKGSMAHGIIYGPQTGARYPFRPAPAGKPKAGSYGGPRQDDGGAVMHAIRHGEAYREAASRYLIAYMRVLRRHGFDARTRRWL